MVDMSKVWLITGVSRGFGEAFARAALERGDRVAGTARRLDTVEGLKSYGDAFLPLQLDVTDRAADFTAVHRAHAHFGRLDVVVNNAGYGHFGFFEEITEAEARAQLETNVFGAMWITQAALPILRAQGHGHIIQLSSIGGVVALPSMSIYHASKWALEGLSEALAQEVAGQGIKVTLVEPGLYGTEWAGSSAIRSAPDPVYDDLRQAMAKRMGETVYGDPKAAAQTLLEVVDSEQPPLRILFGGHAFDTVQALTARRVQSWNNWESLSRKA